MTTVLEALDAIDELTAHYRATHHENVDARVALLDASKVYFRRALELIEQGAFEDKDRALLLATHRRLTLDSDTMAAEAQLLDARDRRLPEAEQTAAELRLLETLDRGKPRPKG
jgi:hypothetical protein